MGDLNYELNRLAGTTGLDAQGAANVYAGTVGKELVGALNVKAGTAGLELLGVLNKLAGTTGLDVLKALQAISTAFTPTSITGLVGWWDASVASSITSAGGFVSQLNDLSGSGFHLTNTGGAARPTTGAHTQNSLNVIEFGVAAASTFLSNASVSITATNAMTMFAVAVPSATASNERLVSTDAGANDFDGTTRIAAILRDSTNLGMAGYYNSAERGIKAMTNAAHVICSQRTGDSHLMRVDGSAGTTVTGLGTANFGITRFWMGNDNTGSKYTGYLGEVLWYNAALSAGDLALVEAYLKAKWATP